MKSGIIAHIYGSSYIYTGKHAVGIYLDKSSRSAILIDSGTDEQAAREIDEALEEEGYRITAILHTHGHRSSCGGDAYLLTNNPELKVYATATAAASTSQPHSLAGYSEKRDAGKAPHDNLLVTDILPEDDTQVRIGDISLQLITMPGHAPGMVGFLTQDHVLYCGDALFGERILRRQNLLLFMNINDARGTFRKLSLMTPKAYVLYHGGVYRDISSLINQHLERINLLSKRFEDMIYSQPATLEKLVQVIMHQHSLEDTLEHYWLAMQIVQSHIAELLSMDRIVAKVEVGSLHFTSR